MSEEAQAEYWTFPTNPEDFNNDDRISFSKLDSKYIAVQDDGTEYEFDNGLRRWIPIMDDALIEEQQKGYMMPGADNSNDYDDAQSAAQGRKRKKDSSNDREDSNNSNSNNNGGRSTKHAKREKKPRQNTAVYVTGLPLDATVDEVADLFSRKCGVIAEEIDSGRPRIKMYTDPASGAFKGDALVVFFKPQSVDMAIMLLDDTEFRFSPSGLATGRMRVQAADTSYKKTNYDTPGGEANPSGDNAKNSSSIITTTGVPAAALTGDAAADAAAEKAAKTAAIKRMNQDKAKIIRKTQKLDAKLADWDDDDPSTAAASSLFPDVAPATSKRADKVVILRHMFTLAELDEDPAAILDIKEDIREECAKLGPVTNVVLFDQEEDGVVSVKFTSAEAAEACVRMMHGRAFDGRTVEAVFATGKEKFRKSKAAGAGDDE
ncbi:hypothetical protein B0T22DRAFT_84037 [Podospora appendiculata]|uniref:RRM domain-containing protein n=1 Tax=Podospora appendiculata TaxID=314037 RepID=A0AAE0XK41_9PEZI|nr:hypothetical protein B0T22DRAFT_84037 [Podospora appendiculata]